MKNRIKILLFERDIKSKDLAKMLAKPDSTISNWCRNKTQPRAEDLVKLASIFNVSIEEILGVKQNNNE